MGTARSRTTLRDVEPSDFLQCHIEEECHCFNKKFTFGLYEERSEHFVKDGEESAIKNIILVLRQIGESPLRFLDHFEEGDHVTYLGLVGAIGVQLGLHTLIANALF